MSSKIFVSSKLPSISFGRYISDDEELAWGRLYRLLMSHDDIYGYFPAVLYLPRREFLIIFLSLPIMLRYEQRDLPKGDIGFLFGDTSIRMHEDEPSVSVILQGS